MTFICYHCNSCSTKKFNLQRHLSKSHFNTGFKEENDNKKRKSRILCYKCNTDFYSNANYHRHLKKDHNMNINITKMTFSNIPGNYFSSNFFITSALVHKPYSFAISVQKVFCLIFAVMLIMYYFLFDRFY